MLSHDLHHLRLLIMVILFIVTKEKYESYRGDIINSFDCSDRNANPNRMLEAYYKSASTL